MALEHGIEMMRRSAKQQAAFFIDHPYGANTSWAIPAKSATGSETS